MIVARPPTLALPLIGYTAGEMARRHVASRGYPVQGVPVLGAREVSGRPSLTVVPFDPNRPA